MLAVAFYSALLHAIEASFKSEIKDTIAYSRLRVCCLLQQKCLFSDAGCLYTSLSASFLNEAIP